ncbi:flavodoxin [Virgibacillus sp. DJP39]|uniref:flavodoxin n=1 Tax=Virgibacillus sp. DJP39 TaxID=3409790 RepID=UPI003BB7F2B2
MGQLLILYASGTGNTELLAEAMVAHLKANNCQVRMKTFDLDSIDVDEIFEYDAVLIGTYTWDDGELPYEVEDFYDDLEDVDVTGKVFGVFGSADSFYDTYGGAVDLIADRLEKSGGRLVTERLKVDLEPEEEDILRCEQFVDEILELMK